MNPKLTLNFKCLVICFCLTFISEAQVGIGTTTPNPSSILDIESNSQGLLIPRVALTSTSDATTISDGNVESLLVYNTQTSVDVQPGYYYWSGSEWVRIAAGSNADNQIVTNFSVIGTNLSITLENGNTATVPLSDILASISDTNIYSSNGTLTSNRNVTQNNFDLNFDANTFVIDGASNNVGIGLNNPSIDLAIGDSDTGLQQQGDGRLAIYSNNNERVRINNNGNVGIGTTTPAERLHVNGDSRLGSNRLREGDLRLYEFGTGDRNSRIRFYSDGDGDNEAEIIRGSGTDGSLTIDNEGNGIMYLRNRGTGQIRLGTNNSDDLNIEDGGNIGIGTTNPTARLDVNGTARIRNVGDGAASDNILTRDNNGNIRRRTAAEIVAASGVSDTNIYGTNGTLTGNRNVTQNNFDLNFDANTFVIDGASDNVGIGLNNPSIDLAIGDSDTGLQQQGDGRLAIYTNNNERVRINNNGNVGIGTTTPAERLHVNGDSRLGTNLMNNGDLRLNEFGTGDRNSRLRFYSDGDGDNDAEILRGSGTDGSLTIDNEGNGIMYLRNRGNGQIRLGTNNSDDLNIEDGGNVGIGTNNPTARLDVNGTARIRNVGDGAASDNILTRDNNGNIRRRTAAQIVAAGGGSDDNIYSTSGTISGNRSITQNNFDINFDANTLVIDGASDNVGIGVNNPNIDLAVGDSDTGLQQQGDGMLAIYTNNNERVRISNNGSVGIGTNAPTERLHVNGDSRLGTNLLNNGDLRLHEFGTGDRNSRLRFYSDGDGDNDAEILRGSGTDGSLTIDNEGNGIMYLRNRGTGQIRLGTNNSDDLSIEDGGNIGIGTNDPTTRLDVNGTARIRNVVNGSATDNVLTRDSNGNIRRRTAAEIVAAGGGSDDNIYSTSGTITGNRNITQNNFDVNFDANTLVIDGASDNIGIGVNNPVIDLAIGDNNTGLQQQGDNILAIYTGNNERVRVNNSGNVGIGTNAPTERLHVNGDSRLGTNLMNNGDLRLHEFGTGDRNSRLRFYSDGDGNNDAEIFRGSGTDGSFTIDNEGNGIMYLRNRGTGQIRLGTNNSDDFNIADGGDIGIGVNNPTARLDVNGTARIRTVDVGASTDNILTRDNNGNIRRRTAAEVVAAAGISNNTASNGLTQIGNDTRLGGVITANTNIEISGNRDLNFDSNTFVIDGGSNNIGIGVNNPVLDLAIGDSNTGLQQQGDNILGIYTNNNERIRIESDGDVGIGIATPSERLHVNGNSRLGTNRMLNGELRLDEFGTTDRNIRLQFYADTDTDNDAEILRRQGVNGDLIIDNEGDGIMYLRNRGIGQIRLGTNDSDDLYIEDGGNIGIATNDPTARLDISGNARIRSIPNGQDTDDILTRDSDGNIRRRTASQIVAAGGGSDDNIYNTNGTLTGNRTINLDTQTIDFNGSADNAFQVDGSTLTVDADTNRVGIGTTTPEERLNVDSGILQVGRIANTHSQLATNRAEVGINTGSVALTINDGGGNANVTFNHAGEVPDASGNAARISVNVDSSTNPTMEFELAEGVTAGISTSTNLGMALTNTGLGIGITPSETLDVDGAARVRDLSGSGNRTVYADASGVLQTRSTRSATFARSASGSFDNSDIWRRISNTSATIDVMNGDVLLVNWSTIISLTGASTTDDLDFEVRLIGGSGCSDVTLSVGTYENIGDDTSNGYNGTRGTSITCDGSYTIELWARCTGTDNWSYNEANVTATIN